MSLNDRQFFKPLVLAVMLHFALFIVLFSSFFSHTHQQAVVTSPSESIIRAVAVNTSVVHKIEALQAKAEQEKKSSEEPQVKPELQPKVAQKETMVETVQQQKEIARQKQKALLEAKVAAKKAEKMAKQKALLAEKQKQQALAKKRRQLIAADLQKQLAAEDRSLQESAQRQQMASGEVNKYKAMILQAIQQRWLVPPNSNGLSCRLSIHLAPGGMVLDVKLMSSSGNSAFDRSAIVAAHNASPLPVPSDNALFTQFRDLNLTVQPEA